MSPYCTKCGNEVEESWRVCPNCGKNLKESDVPQPQPSLSPQIQTRISPTPQPYQTQPYQQQYRPVKPTQYGTPALVCGLIGCCCGFLGIPAIILGALGLSRDENTSSASIGLILGLINTVCWILGIILLFTWFPNIPGF